MIDRYLSLQIVDSIELKFHLLFNSIVLNWAASSSLTSSSSFSNYFLFYCSNYSYFLTSETYSSSNSCSICNLIYLSNCNCFFTLATFSSSPIIVIFGGFLLLSRLGLVLMYDPCGVCGLLMFISDFYFFILSRRY